MRGILYVFVMFSAFVFLPRGAAAQSPWYVTGSSGALLRWDASRSTTITGFAPTKVTGPGTSTASFNAGPTVNLGVGYRLPLGFRIEGDFTYAHYDTGSISPLSTDGTFPQLNGSRLAIQSGGAHDQYEATVNGFYDLPVSWPVVPYFGAGLGAAYVTTNDAVFAGPGGRPKFTERGGYPTFPAIGVEVGATFALDSHWAMVSSYRFEHLFVTANAPPDNASVFKLGLRYSF